MEGAGNKVPKVAIAAIQTLELIIHTFGVKVVPLKPILANFLAWFDHTNAEARLAAQTLTIELYRWVGGAILDKPISNLRQAQVTDLQKAFADIVKGAAVPEKYLRCQVDQMQAAASSGGASGGASAAAAEEIDPYTMVEAVNVVGKITPDMYEALQSKKWKDKKEALEAINKLADNPRLASGDYGELTKNLKRLLGDANVFVVEESVKCLGFLAKGLRNEFTSTAKSTMNPLLDKLKEKKDKVITALQDTFDAYHPHCFALADVTEDILTASKHKVSAVKKELLNWIKRALPKEKRALLTKSLKFWCTLFMELMDDSDSPVRENAFECFGLLIGIMGERQLTGYLNQMDKVKEKRVREFIPSAPIPAPAADSSSSSSSAPVSTIDVNAGVNLSDVKKTSAAPKKSSAAAPASASAKKTSSTTSAPAAKSNIAQPVAKSKIPAPSSSSASSSSSSTPNPATAASSKPVPVETFNPDPRIGAGDAEMRILDLLGETVIAQLGDKDWKQRLDAMSIVASTVERWDATTAQEWAQNLLLFLVVAKPSFKEPNVQVLAKMTEVLKKLCSLPDISWNKNDVYVALAGVIERIHEAKLTGPSIDFLNALGENQNALGLQFVFNALYTLLKESKALKALVEGMAWMSTALSEFGGGTNNLIEMRNLVNFVKTVALEHTNATIKATGIRVLCEVYRQMGSGGTLLTLLSDVKAQLMTTIKKELDKVASERAAIPTKGPNAVGGLAFSENQSSASSAAATSPASSTPSYADMPRVDISAQIAAATPGLTNNDWQKRQEAMASLESLLLEVRRIQPKGISALMTPLKARLSDSNNNLIPQALNLLGEVASASGPTIESHLKTVMPSILTSYANAKATVKSACGVCLDKWVEEVGMDPILPFLPTALGTPSGRADLLAWIAPQLHRVKKGDVKILLKPAFQCFQDKTKEVRTVAETTIIELARRVTAKVVEQECSKIAPGALASVRTLLKNNEAEIAKKQSSASTTSRISRIPVPGSAVSPANSPRKADTSPSSSSTVSIGAGGASQNETSSSIPITASSSSSSSSGPLLRNNKQDERELAEIAWIFDAVAPIPAKWIDALKDQMTPCVTADLLDRLFSTEAKAHSSAIADLESAVDGNKDAVLDSLDVVLKWISWRLYHNNAAILKRVVALLEHLIGTLELWEHKMSDLEAASFIPLVVVRLPHVNETLQSSLRGVLQTVETNFYPPSKIFKLFMRISRNWTSSQLQPSSKVECLQYLGAFVRRQSLSVCDPSEAFRVFSSLLSKESEDSTVIIGALDVFLEAAKDLNENESLWNYISSEHHELVRAYITAPTSDTLKKFDIGLPPKNDEDSTDDVASETIASESSIKKAGETSAAVPEKTETQTSSTSKKDSSQEQSQPQKPVLEKISSQKSAKFTLDLDKLSVPQVTEEMAASHLPTNLKPTQLPASILSNPAPFLPSRYTPKSSSQQHQQQPTSQLGALVASWTKSLRSASASNDSASLAEVLQEIRAGLQQDLKALQFHVEPLLALLLNLVKSHFDVVSAPTGQIAASNRVVLLSIISLFFINEETAQIVPEAQIKLVLSTLIESMLNAQSLQGETETLIASANQYTVAVLLHANRTSTLVALVSLLKEKLTSLSSQGKTTTTADYSSQSIVSSIDVIKKCLMRTIKHIPSSMSKISVPLVLFEIHLFLATHAPYQILHGSKQSATGASILEAIKLLIDKLVETMGAAIVRHMNLVPSSLPPAAINWYIKSSLLSHSPNALDSSVLSSIAASESSPEQIPSSSSSASAQGQVSGIPELSENPPCALLPFVHPRPGLPSPDYRLPAPATDENLQQALKHIFGKIARKDSSSQSGLVDLYWLLKDHAIDVNFEADVSTSPLSYASHSTNPLNKYLHQSSAGFKLFIAEQMKRFSALDAIASASNAAELDVLSRETLTRALTPAQEASAQLAKLVALQSKLKLSNQPNSVSHPTEIDPNTLASMLAQTSIASKDAGMSQREGAFSGGSSISSLASTASVPVGTGSSGTSATSGAASAFRERLKNATSTKTLDAASAVASVPATGSEPIATAPKYTLPSLSAAPHLSNIGGSESEFSASNSVVIPAPTASFTLPTFSNATGVSSEAGITAAPSASSGATNTSSISDSQRPTTSAASAAARLAALTSGSSSIPASSNIPSASSTSASSTSSVEAMRERLARLKGSSTSNSS